MVVLICNYSRSAGVRFKLVLVLIVIEILSSFSFRAHAARPNFLLMLADDLSPYLDPYISSDHPMHGKTPNIKRIVDNGDTFLFTSAQQAVCGPSRTSFLSGRYPETTHIYNFERYLFEVSEKMLTIPKYFKENLGYFTAGFGKVFHPFAQGSKDLYFEKGHFSQPTKAFQQNGNLECGFYDLYCKFDDDDKNTLTDALIANEFINFLEERNSTTQPWLAIVGFRRVRWCQF